MSGAEGVFKWVVPEIFEGTTLRKIWEWFSKLKTKGTKDREHLAEVQEANRLERQGIPGRVTGDVRGGE